jgi:hypothetical protein
MGLRLDHFNHPTNAGNGTLRIEGPTGYEGGAKILEEKAQSIARQTKPMNPGLIVAPLCDSSSDEPTYWIPLSSLSLKSIIGARFVTPFLSLDC